MTPQAHAAERVGEQPIELLFCCDPAYFPHLATAIASVLRSNADNAFRIHLAVSRRDLQAETTLAQWLAGRAGVSLRIHEFRWGDTRWHTSFHITQDAYIRLFAARFLPAEVGKVLYLDADLLVLDDLCPLWELDITHHALAAAPDPYGAFRRQALGMPAHAAYVNSGVLLMNLARWRDQDIAEKLSAFAATAGERLEFHDQDAINAVLHEQTLVVDYRWNLQSRMARRARAPGVERQAIVRAARRPAVLHYTSARKPWLFVMPTPCKRLYWRYRRETPWRHAPPPDRRIARFPEFLLNHLLYAAGVDYTWDRVRRATTIGRGLDRLFSILSGRPA